MEKYDTSMTKEEFFAILDHSKKEQAKILPIFKDLYKICVKNNIQFSLCEGSLLGAVRHRGFVPWDDDIDVYMTLENLDRLKSIPNQSIIITYSNHVGLYFCNNSSNEKIDIMTNKFKNKKYTNKNYTTTQFEEIEVLIPEDYEHILNNSYKNWQNVCCISNHKIAKDKFNKYVAYDNINYDQYVKISLHIAKQWTLEYENTKK